MPNTRQKAAHRLSTCSNIIAHTVRAIFRVMMCDAASSHARVLLRYIHRQRGTPSKNRSFFSTSGSDNPRTPADVSWIREQAGTTPRALDRDFLAASPAAAVDVGVPVAAAGTAAKQASATATPTKSKMFNRRTWTKEENDQLHEGIASLGGPNSNFGKNVSLRDKNSQAARATLLLKQVVVVMRTCGAHRCRPREHRLGFRSGHPH